MGPALVRVAGDWTQPASASAVMQNKGSRIILRMLQSRRNPEYRTIVRFAAKFGVRAHYISSLRSTSLNM
jgi:hypothetical protein